MGALRIVTTVLILVLGPVLGWTPTAPAQTTRDLGGVLDTLSGIIGGSQKLHGHVVLVKGNTIVFRSDDGRTFAADASGIDSRIRGILQSGDGVSMTVKAPRTGDKQAQSITASALEPDPDKGSKKTYQRIEGTVQESKGNQVVFKTKDGLPASLDVSTIKGLPALSPNAPATLFYEQGAQPGSQSTIAAVWIEPGTVSPSASRSSGTTQPSATIPTEREERLHGTVESVAVSSLTLSADDGRKITVDTTGVDARSREDVRPGDLVTVFGRLAPGAANTFTAEALKRESASR